MKIINHFKNLLTRIFNRFYVTNSEIIPNFSQTCDISTAKTRDIKSSQSSQNSQFQPDFQPVSQKINHCPYCCGKNIVKKGTRKKKLETVQLFYCNDCKKVFTPQKVKGKQFPLNVILPEFDRIWGFLGLFPYGEGGFWQKA
jgi:superfamily II helicase